LKLCPHPLAQLCAAPRVEPVKHQYCAARYERFGDVPRGVEFDTYQPEQQLLAGVATKWREKHGPLRATRPGAVVSQPIRCAFVVMENQVLRDQRCASKFGLASVRIASTQYNQKMRDFAKLNALSDAPAARCALAQVTTRFRLPSRASTPSAVHTVEHQFAADARRSVRS
jgi:hypothetical protein